MNCQQLVLLAAGAEAVSAEGHGATRTHHGHSEKPGMVVSLGYGGFSFLCSGGENLACLPGGHEH